MEATELAVELGKRIGIELAFDADGACAFEADGITVSMNNLPETGMIVVSGDVGEPPPERLEGLYKTLLSANHLFADTSGAALSLNSATGRITLCKTLPVALADADSFYADIERFVNTAETWRKIVADYRGAADIAPPETSEATPFQERGFMQV